MIIFDGPFVRMVYLVYLISFFLHWTIILSIMGILLYYRTRYHIVHLTSFLNHQIIVFSHLLLYTICLFFLELDQYAAVQIFMQNIS